MNYLITDGSSSNTLSGNEGGTGDFIGLLLADLLPGTGTVSYTHLTLPTNREV